MDGFQIRIKDSLQLRLSLWLSAIILGVAVIGGCFTFYLAFNEAHEIQDGMLRQTAALFDAGRPPVPETLGRRRSGDSDPEARLLIAPVQASVRIPGTADRVLFPRDLADGMQIRRLAGQPYRVFVKTLGPRERIAVAQQTAVRDEAASYSALLAVLPFLILVPILLLVVAALIRVMFAPVAALSAAVDRRDEQDLQPVPVNHLPREIRPFVVAINRLLQRVAESMALQQRFVADAAHELRSPLTALSLQAERLAAADMSACAGQRLAVLREGIERNRVLLDQLLLFARAQAAAPAPPRATSLQGVLRRILEALMPLAEAKRLDIGVDSESDTTLVTRDVELTTAVTNLVTNAIRYTPPGGRITLSIVETADSVELIVEDNGPGIPEADRDRVFEPFYRRLGTNAAGSGLGLSIVKSIVDRLGGQVTLADATESATGLRAAIVLPRARLDSCEQPAKRTAEEPA